MISISRYMTKQIVFVTISATVVVCFAVWMTQSLRLIELIISRSLPASMIVYMATLYLPRFLSIIVPLATFGATLFIYHKLMNDNEIVVMRAAGLSHLAIAKPGIIAALILTSFTYFLSLYLLPTSLRSFKDLQFKARGDYSAALLQEGAFNTVGDGLTVYVRERDDNGELHGIMLHDNRNLEAPVTYQAKRGAVIHGENGSRIVLVNGNRQQVGREKGQFSMLYFDRFPFDFGQVKHTAQVRWREPTERYLNELLRPDGSQGDRYYHDKLLAEGHSRLAAPLLPLTFSIIAMAVLLCGPYNRRGQLFHVLTAVTLIVGLFLSSLGLPHLIAKYMLLTPLIYANSLVPLLIGLYLLAVPPKRRPAEHTAMLSESV